jgi:hypothetical protein
MKHLLSFLIAVTALTAAATAPLRAASQQPPPEVDATVRYLIDRVAESERIFIRNATRHNGAEASRHLERKYAHFKDRIQTVDDFIDLAASRSLLSGQPYLVVSDLGTAIPTARWLRDTLAHACARGMDTASLQCPE